MKKAQNAGQILTYVLAIIIVGMVILFGYKSIGKLLDASRKVDTLQLQRSLSSEIKKVSSTYGRTEVYELNLPKGITEVCFSNNHDSPPLRDAHSPTKYPLIKDSISSNVNKNVFVLGIDKQFVSNPMAIGIISVKNGNDLVRFKCLPVKSNRILLNLTGYGDHVQIH